MCDSVYEEPDAFPDGLYELGIEDGWDFVRHNPALGATLEKYLIQGGACPLHHNGKTAVIKGLTDPTASISA